MGSCLTGHLDSPFFAVADGIHRLFTAYMGDVHPGEYRVTWRAAGEDGHAVRGSFDFMVHAHSAAERN